MESEPWDPNHGIRRLNPKMESEPWNPKVESEDGVRTMESEGGVRGCPRQVLQPFGRPNLENPYASSDLHQQCDVSIYKNILHSGTLSSHPVQLVFATISCFPRDEMFGLGDCPCLFLHALLENSARGLAGIEPGMACSAQLVSIQLAFFS